MNDSKTIDELARENEALRKALREAVIECCYPFTCFGSSEDGYACHGERECFVKRWRRLLGEEVTNG